jgi:hypothetical protein
MATSISSTRSISSSSCWRLTGGGETIWSRRRGEKAGEERQAGAEEDNRGEETRRTGGIAGPLDLAATDDSIKLLPALAVTEPLIINEYLH